MRFLHTADWHLGKRLHKFSLQAEQEYALEQIIDVARSEAPEAVVVAGDVFDTPVPTLDALQLWEHVTAEIVGGLGIPMIVIPGNHDHPERLGVHARVAQRAGLYIVKSLGEAATPIRIGDAAFFSLPFHTPAHVNAAFASEEPSIGFFDYGAAMRFMTSKIRNAIPSDVPAVLIAHAFVEGGGEESEAEDPVHVGGAGAVDTGAFEGFAYVALGHIHRSRNLGSGAVRYCGTPFPYSFSEAGQPKTVSIVEVAADRTEVTEIPVNARRGVRVIDDLSFREVLANAETESDDERNDYVLVRVTDKGSLPDALSRLRETYPNSLLEQPAVRVSQGPPRLRGDARTLSVEDVFRQFYTHAFGGEPMSDMEEEILKEVLHEDVREAEATA